MAAKPLVFVSYARTDREPVRRIVDTLRKLGINTWVDSEQLVAGESWERSISNALRQAQALLVFISPAYAESQWVVREFEHALTMGVRVLPVLIKDTPLHQVPVKLQSIQWLDATRDPFATATEIARILGGWFAESAPTPLKDEERDGLAKALAAQTKGAAAKPADETPTSVFLVHGHDEELLQEVVEFVEGLGIKAIVLREVGSAARSLIDKFFEIGGEARFAIVLLGADDMGASRIQYEEPNVGPMSLKYRSRQNTILELGYFYGLLGWDRVFVLEKAPPKRFPDFERPSDLNGVVFDRYDAPGKWKKTVANRLKNHGFVFANRQPSSP
jgi:predicted nucleotide-binding protein